MFGYKDTADTAWIDRTDIVWHELGFYAGAGTIVLGAGEGPEIYHILVPAVFDYGFKDTVDTEWHDQTEVIWAPLGIKALSGAFIINPGAVVYLRYNVVPFVSTMTVESDYWVWEQISSREFNIKLKTSSVVYFVDN